MSKLNAKSAKLPAKVGDEIGLADGVRVDADVWLPAEPRAVGGEVDVVPPQADAAIASEIRMTPTIARLVGDGFGLISVERSRG